MRIWSHCNSPRLLADGNAKEMQPLYKIISLIIHLLYDLAIGVLGIYSKEMKTQNNAITCTLVFTAASFITHKKWKQFKCQSTDEWINKMWNMHILNAFQQ